MSSNQEHPQNSESLASTCAEPQIRIKSIPMASRVNRAILSSQPGETTTTGKKVTAGKNSSTVTAKSRIVKNRSNLAAKKGDQNTKHVSKYFQSKIDFFIQRVSSPSKLEPRELSSGISNELQYEDIGELPSTSVLPVALRPIFPFHSFNSMQSESFDVIYNSNVSAVISSPTGSGKTVLFELAILRTIKTDQKILYLAPTKALCNDKYLEWQKFKKVNISIGILTSDTPMTEMDTIKNSNIIIATPEKWDLLTRRWDQHRTLFDLIKLLLIDEVHSLKDPRGAALEVVVTRMKRMCCLRVIALSATVLNIEDIAEWVKLSKLSDSPAAVLKFDDSYRAVALEKVVCAYRLDNDFQFDTFLNSKLCEIIRKHNPTNKPTMVFCPTRNSCVQTAKYVFKHGKFLSFPSNHNLLLKDIDLTQLATRGIAFHHAGLAYDDRIKVENAFISNKLRIIFSTSTLAVGVNLPAYLVVIKGTTCWLNGTHQEYLDLNVLQMMGRAGRPQFEKSGKAVIVTKLETKGKYENLMNGTAIESSLQLNFLESLVTEIYLGSIKCLEDAISWMKSTFFYVRFLSNPSYYANVPGDLLQSLKNRLQNMCEFSLKNLDAEEMVTLGKQYTCTVFGQAMSRHCIMFETMRSFVKFNNLSLKDILIKASCSQEFLDIQLKHTEKRLFREIGSSPLIKCLPVNAVLTNSDKVFLIIQFVLGGLEFPPGFMNLYSSFLGEKTYIFKQLPRILNGAIDVFVARGDSYSLLNTLSIVRSLHGECWEDCAEELRQIEGIGVGYLRKLVSHEVQSLKAAQALTGKKFEEYLGLKSGGSKFVKALSCLPDIELKLNYDDFKVIETYKQVDKTHYNSVGTVKIYFSVSIRVNNPNDSTYWGTKFVWLNVTTELDGTLIDFRKFSVSKMNQGWKTFELSFRVERSDQVINCHLAAASIASVSAQESMRMDVMPKEVVDLLEKNTIHRCDQEVVNDAELHEYRTANSKIQIEQENERKPTNVLCDDSKHDDASSPCSEYVGINEKKIKTEINQVSPAGHFKRKLKLKLTLTKPNILESDSDSENFLGMSTPKATKSPTESIRMKRKHVFRIDNDELFD